ncbi:MAG: STAS domain-containing protein [Burkholderiales bacterium]|nr:STAS domain-containing protein [Phycisphaerae bacterium]
MTILTELRDVAIILHVAGGIDTLSTELLERAADGVIVRKPGAAIVDLSELLYINSLAIGVLTRLATTVRRSGRIAIVIPPGDVRDVFVRSRVIDLFEQFDDVDAAVAATAAPVI